MREPELARSLATTAKALGLVALGAGLAGCDSRAWHNFFEALGTLAMLLYLLALLAGVLVIVALVMLAGGIHRLARRRPSARWGAGNIVAAFILSPFLSVGVPLIQLVVGALVVACGFVAYKSLTGAPAPPSPPPR